MDNINKITLNYFTNSNNLNKIKKEENFNFEDLKKYNKRIKKYITDFIDRITYNNTNTDIKLNDIEQQLLNIISELMNDCKNKDIAEICQKEFEELNSETIENIEELDIDELTDISGNIYEYANKLLINNSLLNQKKTMKEFLKTVSINNETNNKNKFPKPKLNI